MTSKLQAWCDSLLELSWLAALVISPLFFNVHSDRVFEPDKITLVRSLAVMMIVIWLIRFVDGRGWEKLGQYAWRSPESVWRKPFVMPMMAIVAIYLVSTIFSVTPAVSWAGSYQRLQGTYTTLSYIVIFFVMAATIRDEKQIHRLVTTAIIMSIPVSLYGMLQRIGFDPLPWGGNTVTRIAGHMGNAIFLGAWLVMVTPLTLGRIISSFTNILSDEELNVADIIRSSIYIFVLAIQMMAIYWTFSRGPLLGLLVGIFAFVTIFLVALRNLDQGKQKFSGRDLFYASLGLIIGFASLVLASYLRPAIGDLAALGIALGSIGLYGVVVFVLVALRVGWRWLWLGWLILALYGALWLTMFNLHGLASESLRSAPVTGQIIESYDAWRDVPGVGRYGDLLNSDQKTSRVRIYIWQGAVELILPHEPLEFPDGSTDKFNFLRPLIGYGPESMYVAYNRFYPPLLGTVEARNASPDRAHNETWDSFVITGLIGFIAWQWLYIAIFTQTLSWLGVVRSKRDSRLFILLWIGIGLLLGLSFSAVRGTEFFGVAYPAGSILGLILYLIYYAISFRPTENSEVRDPFERNTITMIATIGAITAFYVEIHFGIAIVSTRTYFFAYAGILYALGHTLKDTVLVGNMALAADHASELDESQTVAEPVAPAKKKRGKGRKARGSVRPTSGRNTVVADWVRPSMIWMFVLALMLGTLAFNYTVYAPPPDRPIQTLEDLPSAWDIFQQSVFVNPRENFSASPYIFLVMMMSWVLGTLIALSEMAKSGLYSLTGVSTRNAKREQIAGYLLAGLCIVFVGLFIYGFFFNVQNLNYMERIGYVTMAPLGALITGLAGARLLGTGENGPEVAASVGLAGIGLSLPMMLTGESIAIWLGVITFAAGILLLTLFWNKTTASLAAPALFVSIGSLGIGLLYQFMHASRLRQSFITPPGVNAETLETIRRVAEADQFSTILGLFYIFLFFAMALFALFMSRDSLVSRLNAGFPPAFLAMVILIPFGFYLVNVSNLRIIQADIIYKRGKPWDNQAAQMREEPEVASRLWDNSIAIYERALEMAPREDFYYLWLGRAYLEKSSYLEGAERDAILSTAEQSLFTAQKINPLNTDHTANLARLNSRWASLQANDPSARSKRVENATSYYQAATALSPQNSTIWNEFARMNFAFTQECESTIDLYQQSAAADPLYPETHFQLTEALVQCALREDGEAREAYYPQIIRAIEMGTSLEPNIDQHTRRWADGGQNLQQLGGIDVAVEAYNRALENPTEQYPEWRLRFFLASAYNESGEAELALANAEAARAVAPADVVPQLEEFIAGLN